MITTIQQELTKHHLNGLWITSRQSIQWLINVDIDSMERFTGLYIQPKQRPKLLVNDLFPITKQTHFDIIRINDASPLIEIMRQLSQGERIGVDRWMPAYFLMALMDQCQDTQFIIGSDLVDKHRAIKSNDEIEKMKVASQINDKVMVYVKDRLKIGVTELEIATFIKDQFNQLSDGCSFDPIVAFGENGANPHATPTERRLKANESIIIDMGCIKDGYCSDMTRTFISGNNQQMDKLYQLVKQAHQKAIESIKPGMTFSQLDNIARSIINDAGYTTEFNHRLGHGIGREVHEPYDVSASNHALIEPGMCFSIEPGIYLEGVGGVRLENLVYVDQKGKGISLNHYPLEDYRI